MAAYVYACAFSMNSCIVLFLASSTYKHHINTLVMLNNEMVSANSLIRTYKTNKNKQTEETILHS